MDKSLLNLELTEERLLLEFNASRMQAAAQLEATVPAQLHPDEPDDIEVQEEALPFDDPPIEEAEFEPVDEVEPEAPEVPEHRVKPRRRSFKVDALDALMEKGWAKDRPEAMATLNLSGVLIRDDPLPRIVAWAALYVAQVTKGVDIEEAAAAADKMIPQQGVK